MGLLSLQGAAGELASLPGDHSAALPIVQGLDSILSCILSCFPVALKEQSHSIKTISLFIFSKFQYNNLYFFLLL